MKNLVLLLFTFWATAVFAQTSGNLTGDTTQANLYLQQAQHTDIESSQKLERTKKAFDIYRTHPESPRAVQATSLYAYALVDTAGEKAKVLALTALNQAEQQWGNSVHLYTVPAYLTLMLYEKNYKLNPEKIIEYGEVIASLVLQDSPYFFRYKYLMANAYSEMEQDKYLPIISEMEKALENSSKLTRSDSIYYYMQLMSHHHLETENFEKSLSYAAKLSDLVDANDFNKQINIGYWSAISYGKFEKFEKAEEAIDVMIRQVEAADIPNQAQKARYYHKIASACVHINNLEETITYAQLSLDILLDLEGDFKETIAYVYSMQGLANKRIAMARKDVYFDNYEPKELGGSDTYFLRAYELYNTSLSYADDYIIRYYIAHLLKELGRYDEALVNIQKSMELYIPGFKPSSVDDNPSPDLMSRAGNFAFQLLYDKAAAFVIQSYFLDKTLTANARNHRLQTGLNTIKQLIDYQEQKLSSLEGYEQSMFKYNKRTVVLYAYARLALYFLHEKNPSPDLFDQMFYYTEKRKVMSLIETLTPSKLPEGIVQQEIALKNELLNIQQQIGLATKDSLQYYQDALFSFNQRFEDHKKMVQQKYPKEANNFYNIEYATPDDIAAELDDETLYISVDAQYFGRLKTWVNVTVIDQENRKVSHSFQDSLLRHIWTLEKLQKNPLLIQKENRKKFIHHSHQLYNIFLAPFEEQLKGKTKLVVVQEGHLLRVPFDVLLASNEKKPFDELDFLIKKYDITYHYSATAYLKLKNKKPIRDNSLLAFAPVFEQEQGSLAMTRERSFLVDSLHRSVEGERFIPLPHTKKEIQSIHQTLEQIGKTQVLLEDKASKFNLLVALEKQSYQFVHIATHGLVNMENHRLSGLACALQDEKEDALLFANEIQQLNIEADLVVLSSCESGVGMVIRGEGLIAINRAFFYAGAKNIIFSLWKVNDKYTSDLMIDFYKNYLTMKDYSQALRQAKLKMLENPTTANPRFWAPFVLIGE